MGRKVVKSGLIGILAIHAVACSGEAPSAPGTAPLLIAHRGASAYAPEHTMPAYRLALEQGADFIEPDLQVTRDGQLIALHDETLERTTNVRDVFPDRFREDTLRGEPVRRWHVADFTLEEIRTLDAGAWFAPEFAGERVPTFAEVIELARGRAGIIPETKAPEVYRDLGHSMERLVLADLERYGLDENGADPATPVVIQSFSRASLEIFVHELASDLPLVFLLSGGAESVEMLSPEGLNEIRAFATGIGPTKRLLLDDPSAVARAHAVGLTVIPYTFSADDPGDFPGAPAEMAYFLFDLGVDGLFTNNPDLFPRARPGTGS
ncbi:MAG: glycerophosphodiester phosphodiesterase family protein [Gemmatimonadales bacterium]